VALVGKIQDMRPAEILIFLGESEKTGKLSFTTGTREGMIVFRKGKIIYAASSSIRETFGSIALSLEIVNRRQLDKALQLQHTSREEKRLGEILVEIKAMTEADVQRILVHQVSNVVNEIFEWEKGYFKFKNIELDEYGDVEVDAGDFVVDTPLDTRSVTLDAARMQDESVRENEAVKDDGDESTEQTTLTQLMIDSTGPALTAEIVREIFEVAEKIFTRGIIFAIHDRSARGLAQFGLEETVAPPGERVRELVLPVDENSVIARVVREGQIYRGEPDHVRSNAKLVYVLGGDWPKDSVALPMMIGDRVALVIYGDNQPRGVKVGRTFPLEATLKSVGTRLAKMQES
jgi:hypothetical protein